MNALELLKKAIAAKGQAKVARAIGYSTTAVSQAARGKYRGNLYKLLACVEQVYGNGTVACPVMGDITIERCAAERKKPFAATSPQRVRLYRACRVCVRTK